MKVDILLGLQWGDEGKGKIVDFLAPKYNVVARFQGGPNAGHTLEFDGIKHVLHQIPSGIFRESISNIIGNGVVLDPVIFKEEVHQLENLKVDPKKNLLISKKAQLILPTHRLLDQAYEKAKGEDKIGHVLISGPARSGKSTTLSTLATVLRSARPDIRITALTPRRSLLADCADVDVLVHDPEQLGGALGEVASGWPHAILIDDAEDVDDSAGTLAALIADRHPHCHIFAAGAADVLRSAYGHWTQAVRRSRLGLALKPNPTNDGDLWQTTLPRHGPAFFPAGRGYLVAEGSIELCQVAWQ